jgi:hypothetical protein
MRTKATEDASTTENELVNLNARIPRRLYRRVKVKALEEDRLLRDFIRDALHGHLSRKKRGRG